MTKVGYCSPPPIKEALKKRPYAPHAGHKGPYLTPLIKKFLEKNITYEDPETQKKIKGRVKDAIIWRLILNGCQGENEAIKEILNRVDGKLPDTQIDQSTHQHYVIFRNPKAIEENASDIRPRAEVKDTQLSTR